jgi:hypothetical protein
MGKLHEFLIVLLPEFHVCLPERILAQHQHADTFLHQQLDTPTAGGMQILHHAPIALRRETI